MEALFGDIFLAVQFKDGFPAITEPESLFFAFIRDGGAYVSSPTAAQKLRLGFHRFAAYSGLWIVQLVQVDEKQVNHLLAKRVDNRLYIDGVGIDGETLEMARDSGVAFEGDASKGASIASRPALEKMLKTYADVHGSTLNVLASKSEDLPSVNPTRKCWLWRLPAPRRTAWHWPAIRWTRCSHICPRNIAAASI